jgi:adenylate cyclase, class 2
VYSGIAYHSSFLRRFIVSTETEVKISIDDPAGFCLRLAALDPIPISARHFEDNHLLDFQDESLKTQRHLLRIRWEEGRGVLTFKGAPCDDGVFKIREELETGVDDTSMALQILNRIGMQVHFRYQKYRQEFTLDGVHVAVDETPIGFFVELEGSKETIRNLAQRLGFEESQFISLSYYALYVEHCRNKGIVPRFMVFADAEKRHLFCERVIGFSPDVP